MIAVRGTGLRQVIGAVRERPLVRGVQGEACGSLKGVREGHRAGRDAVDGLRAVLYPVVAVSVILDRVGRVEGEGGTGDGVSLLVHLLDEETVLDVGDEQLRGKLAGKVVCVDADGVVLRGSVEGVGGGVVDGNVVLGVCHLVAGHHVGVVARVTRQVVELDLVLTARREREGGAALLPDGLDGTGEVSVADGLVAVDGVSHESLPRTVVVLHVDDGEHGALAGRWLDGTRAVRGPEVAWRSDRLLRGDVAAVEPPAVDREAILRVCGGLQRAAAAATLVLRPDVLEVHRSVMRRDARVVAVGHADLLEHEVGRAGVRLLVEGDHGVVADVREVELAVGVGRARGDGVAGDVVVLVGLVELELGALDGAAVLVDLQELGDGLGHEVELEVHVRGGGTAL